MERFEIEDIVAQDKNGVIFRATDTLENKAVAIRRFLPFGQNGGGLEKDEATAFEIASKRLSEIQHDALRTVLHGSVDPIDSVPFVVTEWIDGASLKTLLANEAMDPALVIDVLRIALETSIVISHVLGEEAVWVETAVESIVVGNTENGRGFTFWISPFKWLGAEFESRKLSSLVALGEELTGWKKKLVSDQAGYGLGGWLKWLRNNPDAPLQEALETLAASTGKEPPPPTEVLVREARKHTPAALKQPSSKAPLLIAGSIALLVTGLVLTYLHKTAKAPAVSAGYAEQEISPVIVDSPSKKKSPTTAKETTLKPTKADSTIEKKISDVDALAIRLSREARAATEREALIQAETEKETQAQRAIYDKSNKVLSPEQNELIRTFKSGDAVKLRGEVKGTRTSGTGKSIYLYFSEPYDSNLINIVIHKRDFKGDFQMKAFEHLIGEDVTIQGNLFIEFPHKKYFVKITSLDQIK